MEQQGRILKCSKFKRLKLRGRRTLYWIADLFIPECLDFKSKAKRNTKAEMSDNEFIELDDDDVDGDIVIGDTSSETSGTSEGNHAS